MPISYPETNINRHKQRNFTLNDSISTNPYFFYGPFSGLLVSNAGHSFLPRLMANFSTQYPNGMLNKKILMSIFAVFENPVTGVMTHRPGHERIPNNWYRRPARLLNDYGIIEYTADLLQMAAVNPQILKVGGNTGTVNSFAGVDLGNLTGGVYHLTDLLNPEKLGCFLYQVLAAILPDILRGGLLGGVLSIATNLLTTLLAPLFGPTCPPISQFNSQLLNQFPGASIST